MMNIIMNLISSVGCHFHARAIARRRKAWFIYFIFICHTIITKKKKKRRGDLTETIRAYERLGLLELRAGTVSHQLKKRWRKVEDGKIYELFSYLLNNLIFSFFLKEDRN